MKLSFLKSGVPKIIHQIWIGKEIYSNDWKKMKGWNYKLWTNEDNFPLTWYIIEEILEKK